MIEFLANRDMNRLERNRVPIYEVMIRDDDAYLPPGDDDYDVRAEWLDEHGQGQVAIAATLGRVNAYRYRFTDQTTAFAFKLKWATSF
ncbi:MAG: hypothetical protein EOP83_01130 [Verrucomicrobiaceae bacterium]|nr:MAG: hypothetical protein EOP83_01130 [Verrucomicrobiaceae bacterium]